MVNEDRSSVNNEREPWKGIRWNILVNLSLIRRMHIKPSKSGK